MNNAVICRNVTGIIVTILMLLTVPTVDSDEPDQNPVRELVMKFFNQFDSQFTEKEGTVIRVEGETVYVNIGKHSGVIKGMQFDIYRKGEVIQDPHNPDNRGYIMEFVNTITIDLVQDDISSGRTGDRFEPTGIPQQGDLVAKLPLRRIAFTFQENESFSGYQMLQVAADILSYRAESTGRYTVVPVEKFREALSAEDGAGDWKSKVLNTANWLNLDVVTVIQLTQTDWDLGLNGYIMSVPERRIMDFILSTIPTNAQISSLLHNVGRPEPGQYSGDLETEIATVTVRQPVLDACTYDVDNDGKDELFVLYPDLVQIYNFLNGKLQEQGALSLSQNYRSYSGQKNELGKIIVYDMDGDHAPECYARSSQYTRGFRWIYQDGVFRMYDTFYGYPLGVDFTPQGHVLTLAKLVEGKDHFTGDLYYKLSTETKPRYLTDPDSTIEPFYNFCTIFDMHYQNLVSFLDLDYHVHFMTSTGGAFLQDRYLGLAMAIGDIDMDTNPDLFVSAATLPGEPDYVSRFEVENNELQLRWQGEKIDGSIYVLTLGDLDGNGKEELITFREHRSGDIISTAIRVLSNK